ncbi:CocE/NonD family hydrolase [Hydrocarboniphaga effusa]|jgi:hypothetical protein|nr:CocE/NonD family hydrolase [Hydrocarboniphaga sp.]
MGLLALAMPTWSQMQSQQQQAQEQMRLQMQAQLNAQPQSFEFQTPSGVTDPKLRETMRDLAVRVLPVYQEKSIDRYLSTISMLQLVAANYPAAYESRKALLDRRRKLDAGKPMARSVVLDLYALARAKEVDDRLAFNEAFSKAYREVAAPLGDRDAFVLGNWIAAPLTAPRSDLENAFARTRKEHELDLATAIDLVRLYLAYDSQRSFVTLAPALMAEDDARRYVIEDSVPIRSAAGVTIYARLVRPKTPKRPLPALLEFTLDPGYDDARARAARGYVGVVAYTRGRGGPADAKAMPAEVVPFQHDGADARKVIDWITQQPWSDGRVGLVGSGYSGFAAWSVAKKLPAAVKAIATTDAMAPGIDFPTQGRIAHTDALRWIIEHTQPAAVIAQQPARWDEIELNWYRKGRSYWVFDRLAKLRSDVFRTWITHPSYDGYWQNRLPYARQFAQIGVPVLSSVSERGDGIAALYYFGEHLRYRPDADHSLVIASQSLDQSELRLQWFDHVFKNAGEPSAIRDRVNVQLDGGNANGDWRHAASIEALATSKLSLHLSPGENAERHRLTDAAAPGDGYIEQSVQLADRRDTARPWTTVADGRQLRLRHALAFVGEPLAQAVEINGLPSGTLDFELNKMDVDLNLSLFEQLAGGEYRLLAEPYEFRASYAKDRVHRHMLRAGERQQLAFKSERFVSARLAAGSRLVLVLGVNKRPDREINYGTGRDVKEESIEDARPALRLRWYGGSRIEIPVRR